jgi:hypothetical protein
VPLALLNLLPPKVGETMEGVVGTVGVDGKYDVADPAASGEPGAVVSGVCGGGGSG